MYRVYQEHVATGKVDYVGSYSTKAEAAQKIAQCHKIDRDCCAYGEYYYYIK